MNYLKQLRLYNRWTQQYVADEIGIKKATYSNVETEKRTQKNRPSGEICKKSIISL